jgi:hypothetical protein
MTKALAKANSVGTARLPLEACRSSASARMLPQIKATPSQAMGCSRSPRMLAENSATISGAVPRISG